MPAGVTPLRVAVPAVRGMRRVTPSKSGNATCPCGSGNTLDDCCGPYITGDASAPTAQALMRSRYTAYVMMAEDYLLQTWHPRTRPSRVRLEEEQRWLGLSVRRCSAGGIGDDTGDVEFVARFKRQGKGFRLHEISRFRRLNGDWFYLDGRHL